MLPEAFQSIQRLLLLSTEQAFSTQLVPALQQVNQVFPTAEITLYRVLLPSAQSPDFQDLERIMVSDSVVFSGEDVWGRGRSLSTTLTFKEAEFNLPILTFENYSSLARALKNDSFDAAIIFTSPFQSPYTLAYLCYLSGISIRIGQSQEFGGGVLSHSIQPCLENSSSAEYHLHLLNAASLSQF